MNRRLLAGLLVLCLLPYARLAQSAEAARRPNIVFILIDDLGWRDVGFMGSTFYETPNIDRLAAQSMVFTSAYTNGPNCAPTRASLMSGQYSPRHGVYTVGSSKRGKSRFRKLVPTPNKTVLDDSIVTLAESLKAAGYATASIGKWHLGPDPRDQGFDLNVGGNRRGSPGRGGYFSPYRNPDLKDGPEGEYLTDRLTDEALRFIEQNRARPFFLYLPHYGVHSPIQAKPELTAKYRDKPASGGQDNAKYAAMIESVDQSVGRLLKKLDELQLADNTLVVLTSDNGGVGGTTSMAPLRGAKGMLYEGGVRVPLIVRWPGHAKPGSRCDAPVISIDFYPTLLEIAAAPSPDQPLDGESLIPLLNQTGKLQRDAIYWHFPAYLQAYQGGKGHWRTTPAGAMRQGDWKLIEFFEDGRLELYNLADDPGERRDLAEQMPERTQQMREQLQAWRAKLHAPVPTKKNPRYDPA